MPERHFVHYLHRSFPFCAAKLWMIMSGKTRAERCTKADAVAQKVIGDDEKQRQGYRERAEIRDVLGDRLGREVILEPKGR